MTEEVQYESPQHAAAPSSRPTKVGIYPSTKHHVSKNRYITSSDPRGYIPVYEYPLNGQWIMMDIDDGHILWTGIWKALGNGKADIVKMIESNPDLGPNLRRVRGGYLKIQGTWMPYEGALRLARRVAWPIREDLIPLFGPNFPNMCLPPDDPDFGKVAPSGHGRRRARRVVQPRPQSDDAETPVKQPVDPPRQNYHQHTSANSRSSHGVSPHLRHVPVNGSTALNSDLRAASYNIAVDRDRRRLQAAPYTVRTSPPPPGVSYGSSSDPRYHHYPPSDNSASKDRKLAAPGVNLEGPGGWTTRSRSTSTSTAPSGPEHGGGGALPSISDLDNFNSRLQKEDPSAVLRRITGERGESMSAEEASPRSSSGSPSGRHFTSRILPPPPHGFNSSRSELPPRLQYRSAIPSASASRYKLSPVTQVAHMPTIHNNIGTIASASPRGAYDSDASRRRLSYSESAVWRNARSVSPDDHVDRKDSHNIRDARYGARSPLRRVASPEQWRHAPTGSVDHPHVDLLGSSSRISALRHSCGDD